MGSGRRSFRTTAFLLNSGGSERYHGRRESWLKAIASRLVLSAFVALLFSLAVTQAAAVTQAQSPAQSQTHQPPRELKVTEYSLPPDKLAKAEALYKTRTVLYLVEMVFGILVLCVLLKLRVAPVLR